VIRNVRSPEGLSLLVAALALAAVPAALFAADCDTVSTGRVPINDLGPGAYLGAFQGGLYPGGVNVVPGPHATAGVALANAVKPLTPAGAPSPSGRYVMLSIGMSNTSQEFCGGPVGNCHPNSFVGQALAHPAVNHTTLVILNGAAGGQAAETWDSPDAANYDRVKKDPRAARPQ
jgi:hypothetical protein